MCVSYAIEKYSLFATRCTAWTVQEYSMSNMLTWKKDELHTRLLWYCPCCVQSIFPYNHIDDDDEFYSVIIEGVLGYSYQFQEMNKKVFIPFEINDQSDTPLTEIDPDLQFYLETNYIMMNSLSILLC